MVTYLVVTGFGKFNGQERNPSQALVEALPDYLKERGKGIGGDGRLFVASVLTVSAKYVDAWLEGLVEELQDLPYITDADEVVLLHFGVDENCQSDFKLEARAYNEATFRVPDESGWMPKGEEIDPAEAHSMLETDLPVVALAEALQATGAEVSVSHNAGRFVCNYLLFRSLQRSRAAGPRMHSLFVHVPCSRFLGHAQKMLELAGKLMDELCLALAHRPASPPQADGPQQPAGPGDEVANGKAGCEHGVVVDVLEEAPQALDGAPKARSAKGCAARGRGLWVASALLLVLFVVRSKLLGTRWGSGTQQPPQQQSV